MTRRAILLAAVGAGAGGGASFVQMDTNTGRVLDSQWPDAGTVPFGSLMKPFVALAYGASHGWAFPEVVCRRCWKPDGHGKLSLVEAIAHSCNSYFFELAHGCSVDGVARMAATYGLQAPQSDRAESWIGLGDDGWRVMPVSLVRACAELASRGAEIGPKLVLRGMRLSARSGTARAIGVDAFAKTGTGPCTHLRRGSGDGFAMALFPAEAPKTAWLVGVHDRPGSEAARVTGDLIRRAHQPPAAYTGI